MSIIDVFFVNLFPALLRLFFAFDACAVESMEEEKEEAGPEGEMTRMASLEIDEEVGVRARDAFFDADAYREEDEEEERGGISPPSFSSFFFLFLLMGEGGGVIDSTSMAFESGS